jgi:hypothetical protein
MRYCHASLSLGLFDASCTQIYDVNTETLELGRNNRVVNSTRTTTSGRVDD